MAAFRRPGSSRYWIGPIRAGAVDVPRMSTGQTNRTTARAMEDALRARAVTGYADLVRQVADRALDLMEFYTAHLEGDAALQALRERASDAPLSGVVEAYRLLTTDARVSDGLDQLLALAPKGARLSWIREPKNLTTLYAAAVAGKDREGVRRAPNSVRRSLHRAVAEVLAHELGRGQMLAILADARVPSAQDERVVMLTLDEIGAALDAADAEFRPVLGLALTTGIDRAPLLAMRVHHYDPETGTLAVPDSKTSARPRTLALRGEPVLENAEHWLALLVAGRKPDEPLLPFSLATLRRRWDGVRADLKRRDVRWKDLRGIFASYYLLAGGEPRELQHIMGHSTMAMTLRYLRRQPAGNKAALRAGARHMGAPGRGGLRLVKGGAS